MSRRFLVASVVLALLSVIAPAAAQEPEAPAEPRPYDLDQKTRDAFDHIFEVVPEASCVSVRVNGAVLYARDAEKPVIPASTEKLVTGLIALDRLGADHRFTTRVVGAAPVDGVIQGDLGLVGGGDPLLATDGVIAHRKLEKLHPTSVDELADQIVAAGVRQITGRVVGDESRYDSARSVATWPSRFVDQEQSGPLSALSVDDGYEWDLAAGRPARRTRSPQPATSAAAALTTRLRIRGVTVGGEPTAGKAPAGNAIAQIDSANLGRIVDEMLLTSDNQTAELLTKELGVAAGTGGSTEAGIAVIRQRSEELGLTSPGTVIRDGSGLDPENRVTCDQLVKVLDHAGGPDSQIGRGLPVAGESGTLIGRFRDTSVAGRLRAKTGRLNGVSSLAGYVPIKSGETASFSFVVNASDDESVAQAAQTFFAVFLADVALPCQDVEAPVVIPTSTYAASMGTMSMFPLQTVVVPGMVVPLNVFEDRYKTLVDTCLATDADFGVVLISHGSEVGGQDRRTDVGTRVRILRHEALPDGRRSLLAGATERLRVDRWLADDPHPVAEVSEWPDPAPGPDMADRLARTEEDLRTLLALRRELGDDVAPPTFAFSPLSPSQHSHGLAALAPVSTFDRQNLLAAPDIDRRLTALDALLADERVVANARLGRA